MFVRHEGEPHWFVRTPLGDFDPTADQFWTEPPYDEGVGKGFLTRAPSKRACALAEIASIDLPK